MAELLFPERSRCKACRVKLDAIVLDGTYCSYKCAKIPTPANAVEDAPRGCKLARGSTWDWKKRYRYAGEVPERLRNDPDTNVYRCEHCRFLHVGHSRPLDVSSARINKVMSDATALGQTLALVREQRGLDKKFVAAKIKTRPIRITEIEEGQDNIDITVVFKLARFLGLKITLIG